MSPRAFTPAETDAIRARLHTAARDLFGRRGFKGTTVEDLARAAGISKGAFYRFYDGKEALLAAVLAEYEAGVHVQVEDAIRAATESRSRDRLKFLEELHHWLVSYSAPDTRPLREYADVLRNRTCDITYDEYKLIEGRTFSTKRRITVAEKSKLDINLEFKQVNFDQSLDFPFNIPKNYKRR